MLSYPGQHIRKCRLYSIQPLLQTRHVLPSTGNGAPLIFVFPTYSKAMNPQSQFCHTYSMCWVSDSFEIVFQLVVEFESVSQ